MLKLLDITEQKYQSLLRQEQRKRETQNITEKENKTQLIDKEYSQIDFVKMDESQVVKHIPTFGKKDATEHMTFLIQPHPKAKVDED